MRFILIEAVDPEDRKIRLRKVRDAAIRKSVASKMAGAATDPTTGRFVWPKLLRGSDKAVAILQKHTGKWLQHPAIRMGLKFGSGKLSGRRLKAAAHEFLRLDRSARHSAASMPSSWDPGARAHAKASAAAWVDRRHPRRRLDDAPYGKAKDVYNRVKMHKPVKTIRRANFTQHHFDDGSRLRFVHRDNGGRSVMFGNKHKMYASRLAGHPLRRLRGSTT